MKVYLITKSPYLFEGFTSGKLRNRERLQVAPRGLKAAEGLGLEVNFPHIPETLNPKQPKPERQIKKIPALKRLVICMSHVPRARPLPGNEESDICRRIRELVEADLPDSDICGLAAAAGLPDSMVSIWRQGSGQWLSSSGGKRGLTSSKTQAEVRRVEPARTPPPSPASEPIRRLPGLADATSFEESGLQCRLTSRLRFPASESEPPLQVQTL